MASFAAGVTAIAAKLADGSGQAAPVVNVNVPATHDVRITGMPLRTSTSTQRVTRDETTGLITETTTETVDEPALA